MEQIRLTKYGFSPSKEKGYIYHCYRCNSRIKEEFIILKCPYCNSNKIEKIMEWER